MDDKLTRAQYRMAMATGETKTRVKLRNSKHGWVKVVTGITFASTSLFLMSNLTTFADENTNTTMDHALTTTQLDANVQSTSQVNDDQSNTDSQSTQTDNNVVSNANMQLDENNSQTSNSEDNLDGTNFNNQSSKQSTQTVQLNATSGTYVTAGEQNVRDNPSLSSNITGQLDPGDSINYDSTIDNDGYTWLHYKNYAGADRYVAKLNDSPRVDHETFINQLAPGAQSTWDKYGVLPSVSIAQAIVESNWGASAPGNNLYGIKGSYNGQSTYQQTQEWDGSKYVTVVDAFRAYPDFATSIEDHGNFLAVNSRYANLLHSQDYNYVCRMLQADGYATSPTYAETLINVILSNNLARFDNGISNQPNNNQPSQPDQNNQPNNNGDMTPANGSYTLSGYQNVRNGASLSAGVTGNLDAGDTIYYDGMKQADGYTWLHYTNYAGQARWVANLNDAQPAQNNTPAPTNNNNDSDMTSASGSYTLSGYQNVRNGASLSAGVTGNLDAGDTIYYDGMKQADGYTWLHYTNYAGQARWVANLNDAQPAQNNTPAPADNNMTSESGSYTTSNEQNVRDNASLNSGITGTLDGGETIYYDGTKQADGYTWLHYTNYAGQSRWIAKLNLAF